MDNNISFSKPMQATEKVHYKGELRILGQVVKNISDKKPIGYVVMVEKTMKLKMYTVNQTISLLKRFKFVNASLKNGEIINTECAMSRLPIFNTNMSIIGNQGVIILGEIVSGSSTLGYRAIDTNGRIADISESELLKLTKNGIEIINAKIVKHQDKEIISAIKSEFTKIEKAKLDDFINSKTISETVKPLSKAQIFRHKQHRDKLIRMSTMMITKLLTSYYHGFDYMTISDRLAWRETEKYDGRFYEPLKEYDIFCKEIYNSEEYGIKLSDDDKRILDNIAKLPKQDRINYTSQRMTTDTKIYLIATWQFILNKPEIYDRVLEKVEKDWVLFELQNLKVLKDKGLVGESLKKLAIKAKEIFDTKYEEREREKEERHRVWELSKKLDRRIINTGHKRVFKTKTFVTNTDIAQLGFTLFQKYSMEEYETACGYKKKLAFVGDYISNNYEKYKDASRCLGDLLTIAYIEKLLDKLEDDEEYIGREKMINVITIIITIAFMFSSTAMKIYVEDNLERLQQFLAEIPNYDEIANIDYQLNKNITMYYASGFTVFLNDDEYNTYHYKSLHLIEAEIINYRQLCIGHNITHPLLQDEFASAIGLVTPNSVSGEVISEVVGQLRFL